MRSTATSVLPPFTSADAPAAASIAPSDRPLPSRCARTAPCGRTSLASTAKRARQRAAQSASEKLGTSRRPPSSASCHAKVVERRGRWRASACRPRACLAHRPAQRHEVDRRIGNHVRRARGMSPPAWRRRRAAATGSGRLVQRSAGPDRSKASFGRAPPVSDGERSGQRVGAERDLEVVERVSLVLGPASWWQARPCWPATSPCTLTGYGQRLCEQRFQRAERALDRQARRSLTCHGIPRRSAPPDRARAASSRSIVTRVTSGPRAIAIGDAIRW